MALSLTILSIIAASFALGVSFADIRAEARERSAPGIQLPTQRAAAWPVR